MACVAGVAAGVLLAGLSAGWSGCRGTAPPVPARDSAGRTASTAPSSGSSESAASTATPETTASAQRATTPLEAFWQKVLADTRNVPLQPTLKLRLDLSKPDILVYDAIYSSLDGMRIHGFYARPKKRGRYPAVALFHGYGDRGYSEWALRFAERGFAAISIDERGHGKSTRRRNGDKVRVYKPGFPGLMVDGITAPRRYSMVGIVADSVRAVDFLASRPEVDARRLGVTGGSMGGAMSIIVPALDPRVKAAAAGVPYLCDIPDSINRAKADPYLEVARYLESHPADRKKVMWTLSLVDALRFAPKVRVPELVGVGMQDYICPSPGILRTYRRLEGPKKLLVRKDEGHVVLTGWRDAVFAWMEKYL